MPLLPMTPRAARVERYALPAIVAVGALNFFWQLGSSGYFVDEAFSIEHALPSLRGVISAVSTGEATPWTYFALLHEWIGRTGSQAEWVNRLPSALAGVALVATVYWMAGAFLDRRGALVAAGLCALSPLVLEYAQQVRVYVFAMLAVTVAVGATVRAASKPAGRGRLLVLGALAAIASLWLHYAAVLVIAPLCAWHGTRTSVPRAQRAAFLGACLLAALALVPLFADQYRHGGSGGVGLAGAISAAHSIQIAETPFDGRWVGGIDPIRVLAAAVVVLALAVLVTRRPRPVRDPVLLATLALSGPLAILAVGLAGKDVVITRYTAVAAPLVLTAIAAAFTTLPRPAMIPALAATVLVAGAGLTRSHSHAGFYAPARETIDYVRANQRPGDVLITPGYPGDDVPLAYYGERRLHPLLAYVSGTQPANVRKAFDHRHSVWLIDDLRGRHIGDGALARLAAPAFALVDYQIVRIRSFTTTTTFAVFLTAPIRTLRP